MIFHPDFYEKNVSRVRCHEMLFVILAESKADAIIVLILFSDFYLLKHKKE